MRRYASILFAILCTSLVLQSVWDASLAHATFPGTNGLIAYAGYRYDGHEVLGIVVVQPDGAPVTSFRQGFDDHAPAWAPDGSMLAFDVLQHHGETGNSHETIAIARPDGSHVRYLTGEGSHNPAWSPSGQRIVYTKELGGTPGNGIADLFIKNLVTGVVRQLTSNPRGVHDDNPDWSPDGTQVVFQRFRYTSEGLRHRLYSITLSGRHVIRLTTDYQNPSWPSWSPDGTKILFIGREGLSTLTLATHEVDSLGIGFYSGVWSPDGTMVTYNDGSNLFVMPLGGSPVEIVSDTEIQRPSWAPIASSDSRSSH